jgi:hypothetical protein
MLCCAGLFGGMYVGQQLGGPWTVIAPAAGFGLGFIGDMKLMHKSHKHSANKTDEDENPDPHSFQKPESELPVSKGGTSKGLIMSVDKYPDPP